MSDREKRDLWISWTHDAAAFMTVDASDDPDETVDDMVDVATKFADAMLEELEDRFGGGEPRRRKKKGRQGDE